VLSRSSESAIGTGPTHGSTRATLSINELLTG